MSPLTTAISGLLSFLTNEGGLGRYIANCIDTNKEVEMEKYPRLSIFPPLVA